MAEAESRFQKLVRNLVSELHDSWETRQTARLDLDALNQKRRRERGVAADVGDVRNVLPPSFCELHPAMPGDQALLEAFQFCNLDPNNFSNWRMLIEAFAVAAFRTGGPKQAKWTLGALIELRRDINDVSRTKASSSNDTKIAESLRDQRPAKYKIFKVGTLRRRVAEALCIEDHISKLLLERGQARRSLKERLLSSPYGFHFGGGVMDNHFKEMMIAATIYPHRLRMTYLSPSEAEKVYGATVEEIHRALKKKNLL